MTFSVKTIPDMLVEAYGNLTLIQVQGEGA